MNKRFTKLLSVFVIAGAIGAGAAFAATGCNNKPDDPGKQEQTVTVTAVKVTASKTTAKVGEKVTLTVKVEGENNPSQEVTWAITEGSDKATLSGTELTLTKEGTVKVQATSKADTTKKGTVSITVGAAEAKPTVSGVTVTAEGATTILVGDTVNLTAAVAGENNPAQTVTWKIKDGATATGCTVADGVLTVGTVAGNVTVVATSTVDTTKSGELAFTVEALTVESNPVVPTYSGANAGPSNQAGQTTATLCPTTAKLTATPTEDFIQDIFTVKANSEVRARARTGVFKPDDKSEIDANASFTHSVKNGTVEIKAPKPGKLAVYVENGSSTSLAKFKITGTEGAPDITAETAFYFTGKQLAKVVKFEFDVAQAGTYVFAKASGTVDLYKMEYTYELEPSAYTEISVTNKGTTDYLMTQQLDCTGVKVDAIDKNGVPHSIPAENCEFDTSKFNPNAAGEYEIGVTVKLTQNLDGSTDPLKTSYKVKVYAVEELNVYTLSYASNKQSTLKQAYVTGDDFSADNLTIIAKCKIGESTIDYKLKKDWYSVIAPDLNTSGKKQVKVNVSRKYTAGNKNVNTTYDIVVKDKIDAQNDRVELTVGENADFETLTQAVQYLKACNLASDVHKVIKLKAGTYTEKVWIDVDNVTLVGQGATKDDTVVTYSAVEDTEDLATGSRFGLSCATVHVTGSGFKAYNLSIRNDFDYINENSKYGSPQGLALTIAGDGAVLNNVHLYGNQDTLYLKNGRSYFYKSQIDGNIDFIFGEPTGLAYFDECEIKAIVRSAIDPETGKGTNQNGYVTAMKADAKTKPDYGYIFSSCKFTDDGKVADGAMSLGRPWGAKATVAYINCSFTKAYAVSAYGSGNKTDRWSSMSGNEPTGADFCEYGSTGEGAITTAVTGGKVLTETEAANYTKANIFGKANGLSGYSAEYDCDKALKILNILAGVEQGELPKETKITISFKDETLPNGACVEKVNELYAGKITWAGAGSFEVAKPANGIKIGTDTVITVNVVGEVSLVAGYELPAGDYVISYKDGKATIKFISATGTYGTYLGGIVIDTAKTPADTQLVTVTLDYNDGGTTANKEVEAVSGAPFAKPADPVRDGYKFTGWNLNGAAYDFTANVTGAITLVAQWQEQNDYNLTAGGTVNLYEFTTGQVQGSTATYRGIIVDATTGKFAPRSNDVQVNAGVKLKFKVNAGTTADKITVTFTAAAGDSYLPTFTLSVETVGTDTYAVVSITNGCYPSTMTVAIA